MEEQSSATAKGPLLRLQKQYVKNLVFVNSSLPEVNLQTSNESPSINVNLAINAEMIFKDTYEIRMIIKVNGILAASQKELFNMDLTYAAIFDVTNVEGIEKEMILLIYCPGIIFPFARRIVADTTRDGGMPPLMIDVVDFAKLYKDTKMDTAAATINKQSESWKKTEENEDEEYESPEISENNENNDIFEG